MSSRDPTSTSTFRPAADVARDLLRQASPRALREPKRSKRSKREDKSIHRFIDLRAVRVLSLCEETMTVTLILSAADHARINEASREAVRVADHHRRGQVRSPIITIAEGATLPVTVNETIPGAGSTIDLRVGLKAYLNADPVIVTAVAVRIDAVQKPKASVTPIAARITLSGAHG